MKKSLFHIATFLILFVSTDYAQTVIVNKSNNINNLTKAELHNIYLGNTSTWENSKKIRIVDYVVGNKMRAEFCKKFLGLSPKRVSMIWIKVSLSGKTIPPKVFHTEDEIIEYVSNNEGAIGYLSRKREIPNDIKIIDVE